MVCTVQPDGSTGETVMANGHGKFFLVKESIEMGNI